MTSLNAYCICGILNPLPSQSTAICGQWLVLMDVRERKLLLIGSYVSATVSSNFDPSIEHRIRHPSCYFPSLTSSVALATCQHGMDGSKSLCNLYFIVHWSFMLPRAYVCNEHASERGPEGE